MDTVLSKIYEYLLNKKKYNAIREINKYNKFQVYLY